jgi:hypothetical protein
MSDPWLDHIPSHEREKIRKRLRSPEEYERLRERVKGPEDLERELRHNAEFAEVKLTLETEPQAQERAKEAVKAFISEKGMDAAFDHASESLRNALARGNFEVTVDNSGEPKLAVRPKQAPKEKKGNQVPTGKVAEVFHLKPVLMQQIVSSLTAK